MSKFISIATRYVIPAGAKADGLRLAFDVEADGLLDTASKIHCIGNANLDNDQANEYGPDRIEAALEHLARADYLAGHNICAYDLPLLYKLHHWTPKPGCVIVDTLITSRVVFPHLGRIDDQAAGMGGPKLGKLNLRGNHSLEAWGVRLAAPISRTGRNGRQRCSSAAPAMPPSAKRSCASFNRAVIVSRP
jgi:hypothetical protein